MKRTNHINLTLGLDNTTQLEIMLRQIAGFSIRVNQDESLSGLLHGVDEGDMEIWVGGPEKSLASVPLGEIYHLHIF